MKIESIKLKNFKAFQNVEIKHLSSFCIFVGANGSGKSTLFDVFGFLKAALEKNVKAALISRGGFREVVSRGHENEDIVIEIQYRMPILEIDRLVTYHLAIGGNPANPVVKREILRYKRARYGAPFHFLDYSKGEGSAVTNEEDFDKPDADLDREKQKLKSPASLALSGIGQFERFKAASAFRQVIENWHVSDFQIDKARGSKDIVGYDEHLSADGRNLQLVAQYLYENHKDIFNTIIEKMKKRVPGVDQVHPHATEDGKILLKFQDGSFKEPFVDRFVSDGTIKMFTYLVLLHDPAPHKLLCVEEPENQLYFSLLEELVEEFREYSGIGKGQVFVSTHSPDVLNAAELDEVFWLVKKGGFTTIHRAADNEQIRDFMDAGDKMGHLWKQGFFVGAAPE